MKRVTLWAITLAAFLGLVGCTTTSAPTASAVAQQPPNPGPEHQKLQIWIGEWTYSGVAHETPLGPRTEFNGGFTDQLALNGFYVQGMWKDSFGAGIEIHGYDAAAKAHKAFWFANDGSRYELAETYSGDTVTANFTMTDATGKQLLGKAVWNFTPDHSAFCAKWELWQHTPWVHLAKHCSEAVGSSDGR